VNLIDITLAKTDSTGLFSAIKFSVGARIHDGMQFSVYSTSPGFPELSSQKKRKLSGNNITVP
jgi:hypothetical protein